MTWSPVAGRPAHAVRRSGPRRAAPAPAPSGEGPYGHLTPLLLEFAGAEAGDPRRRALRDELIMGYLPVVQHIARRYRGRGESVDDLEQAGVIGLVQALQRFDPVRGTDFLGYLVPTVTGEVRRHFRDRTWSMRVPRRLKDLQHTVRQAVEDLSARLRRAPRPSEIAAHVGLPVEDVIDALQAHSAHSPDSLDAVTGDATSPLVTRLGRLDEGLDAIEHRDALRAALDDLPERERTIIVLRFFEDLTQTQIAHEVGVSQMHVSRLLSRTLATLRCVLDDD